MDRDHLPLAAWASVTLVLASCGPQPQAAEPVPVIAPTPAMAPADPAVEHVAPSGPACPTDATPVSIGELSALVDVGRLRGVTWVLAQARSATGRRAVLLHLSSKGKVLASELPAFAEDVAVEPPSTLHFLESGPPTRWWSVDVSRPDAPVVSAPAPGPELGLDRTSRVKGFAVGGGRALVSVYRVAYSVGQATYAGETRLFDRATGRAVGAPSPLVTWRAACGPAACFGVASPPVSAEPMSLLRLDERGASAEPLALGACGLHSARGGDRWLFAWLGEAPAAFALDLVAGRRQELVFPVSPSAKCVPAEAVEVGGRHGIASAEPPAFHAFGAQRARPLLPFTGQGRLWAPTPDGALVLDHASRSTMMHGPEDSGGVRRYRDVWSFSGRAILYRGGDRFEAWTLPRDGEEGDFGGAPALAALSNGAYAGANVTGDVSEPATFVLYAQPCR